MTKRTELFEIFVSLAVVITIVAFSIPKPF